MFPSTKVSQLVLKSETERAIALKGWKNYIGSSKCWEVPVWVPKSIIKDDIIPEWFIRKTEQGWRIDGINIVLELS